MIDGRHRRARCRCRRCGRRRGRGCLGCRCCRCCGCRCCGCRCCGCRCCRCRRRDCCRCRSCGCRYRRCGTREHGRNVFVGCGNHADQLTHGRRRVLGHEARTQHAVATRDELHDRLVRLDFREHVAALHDVALVLVPFHQAPLFHGRRERFHHHLGSHRQDSGGVEINRDRVRGGPRRWSSACRPLLPSPAPSRTASVRRPA